MIHQIEVILDQSLHVIGIVSELNKGGFMTTERLIELYGHRYTPFSGLAGFVAILIFGILIAFSTSSSDLEAPAINVEQNG